MTGSQPHPKGGPVSRRERNLWFLLVFFFLLTFPLTGAEYTEEGIKLVLHENTGRFTLYRMDESSRTYIPLFEDQDPRTSFLAVMVNKQSYRMGESASFTTRLGGNASSPSFVFESSFLTVTEEFSFVRTASSSRINGVRITITAVNRGNRPVDAGIRLLIDTSVEREASHFSTDQGQISAETQIKSSSGESYWISGGPSSLMGSVSGENITRPDFIHFANWKRLNDTPWKFSFSPGRNFNLLPYSINDSAVCYYYEPLTIAGGDSRKVTLVLSSADTKGFASLSVPVPLSAGSQEPERVPPPDIRADIAALEDLRAKIDAHINSGLPVTEDELAAMGSLINRIKLKHGIP
jgi:hypothetical protein